MKLLKANNFFFLKLKSYFIQRNQNFHKGQKSDFCVIKNKRVLASQRVFYEEAFVLGTICIRKRVNALVVGLRAA